VSGADDLKKAKRRLRAEILARRDAIPHAHRERLGEAITKRFLALPEVAGARTVMAFWAFGSEVPTDALLRRLHDDGVRLALPRIVEGELEPRTYRPGDPVTFAPFGAGEPAEGETLRPGDLDVVIVPGVAFDRRGGRIGYGGGYYDRFLRLVRAEALRASICFGVQLVDEPVPAGPLDLPVDLVVTELEIVRINGGRSEHAG
jgi:5-formyltetrahydrofolate cyclo-ligase